MKWFLLWWIITGNGSAASTAGPFDSKPACEAAQAGVRAYTSKFLYNVDAFCVPSEVPPAAPSSGK